MANVCPHCHVDPKICRPVTEASVERYLESKIRQSRRPVSISHRMSTREFLERKRKRLRSGA